eukprot:GHVR01064650.1.p2 GENE.GHVR01064650.1~~GHVR01064650.1.p2  ORF type:complete len:332 (-),score=76.54 GHVR01064650.1:2850-3845(-)
MRVRWWRWSEALPHSNSGKSTVEKRKGAVIHPSVTRVQPCDRSSDQCAYLSQQLSQLAYMKKHSLYEDAEEELFMCAAAVAFKQVKVPLEWLWRRGDEAKEIMFVVAGEVFEVDEYGESINFKTTRPYIHSVVSRPVALTPTAHPRVNRRASNVHAPKSAFDVTKERRKSVFDVTKERRKSVFDVTKERRKSVHTNRKQWMHKASACVSWRDKTCSALRGEMVRFVAKYETGDVIAGDEVIFEKCGRRKYSCVATADVCVGIIPSRNASFLREVVRRKRQVERGRLMCSSAPFLGKLGAQGLMILSGCACEINLTKGEELCVEGHTQMYII